MIKRVGEPVRRDISYRLRPGAYALLVRDGEVLLTYQDEPEPEFQLPGGGIDQGESTIPALRREIQEETGWHVGPLRRIGAFRRFTFMPEYDIWAEKLCQVYFGRPTLRFGDPTEVGHQPVWAHPELAANMVTNPGDRMFISRLLL